MKRRFIPIALVALLAACGAEEEVLRKDDRFGTDPLVARALNDPLMADPDLAYRNEANAAVRISPGHALPFMQATPQDAAAAREAARLELLEAGTIPDLPTPANFPGPQRLAEARDAPAMLAAAGAPAACAEALEEAFAIAGDLPGPAAIMPHGMVQQAAGQDRGTCRSRVVRYLTAAAGEDVLQYHFTRAARAGLGPTLFDEPEPSIGAGSEAGNLVIAVRPGPYGMSAVDLVWWES